MIRRKLFGPPGTGKTTRLIETARAYIDSGVAPESIGFVSFSREAIKVAKRRMGAVTEAELPHFRTIHSTAYHLLDLHRDDVMQHSHLTEFGKIVGLPIGVTKTDQALWEGGPGDRIMALHQLARARQTSLEHEWRRARVPDLPWELVRYTADLYERFKEAQQLWDFSDMVERATGTLDVDVLFIDEAQDTSSAQWSFLRRVAGDVPEVYFAGDDDQAVYEWGGADPGQLRRFRAEEEVLPKSFRLSAPVKKVADRISARIKNRVPKTFAPRGGEGSVLWLRDIANVNLHQPGSWLLLARSNYQLRDLRDLARTQGVVYSMEDGRWSWNLPAVQAAVGYEQLRRGQEIPRSQARDVVAYWPEHVSVPMGATVGWADLFPRADKTRTWMDALGAMPLRDREYVRALRRSGESLKEDGRVRISTVHGAKGAEADNVLLLTDISERVASSARVDPDAEHRVQYVGVTRAIQRLMLVQPKSQTFWNF